MINITIASDTHGAHEAAALPGGDLLLFCGDFSRSNWHSSLRAFRQFFAWLSAQRYERIIMVGGNNDSVLLRRRAAVQRILSSQNKITYLENSSCEVEVNGQMLRVFGRPTTRPEQPYLRAFQLREREMREQCAAIPECDILVSHEPPGNNRFFLARVRETQPLLIACGHWHGRGGVSRLERSTVVNGALAIRRGMPPLREPQHITLDLITRKVAVAKDEK